MNQHGGMSLWGYDGPREPGRRELAELLLPHLRDGSLVETVASDLLGGGWRPPAGRAATVDELEAFPDRTVVTDPEGHVWVRSRPGEWCEPQPAGIEPDDLLADGPITVHYIPDPGPRTRAHS